MLPYIDPDCPTAESQSQELRTSTYLPVITKTTATKEPFSVQKFTLPSPRIRTNDLAEAKALLAEIILVAGSDRCLGGLDRPFLWSHRCDFRCDHQKRGP
jgi:hypothetical protein